MTVAATYDYRAADGTLRYRVLRLQPKAFRIEDADGRPLPDPLPEELAVLYRADELAAAPLGEMVYVCEGEKDADTLATVGLVATSAPCGTRGGWHPHFTTALAGRHVVVLPDADGPGRRWGALVAEAVRGTAASVTVVDLARGRRGTWDVTNWATRGRSSQPVPERLRTAVAAQRYAQVGLPRPPTRAEKARLIFDANPGPSIKLMLLVVQEHLAWGTGRLPVVRRLAADASLHRVTAQKALTELRRTGILTGPTEATKTRWDVLVVLRHPGNE